MIWDEVEVGSKIEALDTFEVQMGMGPLQAAEHSTLRLVILVKSP